MASNGRRCLPPFTFVDFATQSMPWLWLHDPFAFFRDLWETITPVQSSSVDDQTVTSLSVMDSDLKNLSPEEAEQIIDQFKSLPQSSDRLLFWTGLPKDWVQRWADQHDMLTLTTAMGPLMDISNPRCLRWHKGRKTWSKYIKGASAIFARFACGHGIVRVLTLPPSRLEFLRPASSYRTIEEPVLKGSSGCSAVQINFVHLLAGCREVEYQKWPEDHTSERLECKGADKFDFKLPPRIIKALKDMMGSTALAKVKPGITSPQSEGPRIGQMPIQTKGGPKNETCIQQVECGKPQCNQSNRQPVKNGQPQIKITPQEATSSKKSKQPQSKVQPQAKPQAKPPQTTKKPLIKKQQALNSKPTKQNTCLNQKQKPNECVGKEGVKKSQPATNVSGQIGKLNKKK